MNVFSALWNRDGFHRLPSTTGSHRKDTKRKKPEENAVKYRISAEHLEELTDVLIAEYNGTPHEGNNNLSPLEVFQRKNNRRHDNNSIISRKEK
ncbi:hypothetical protein ACO1C7_29590 [Bacillus cereus]|uniref:hypothetical protein n=1 Tax=Bacillus cereus TaxID=1396 RepID=UPI003BF7511D